MHFIARPAALIGRIFISVLFVLAGLGKIMQPEQTNQMIQNNEYLSGMSFVPLAIGVGLFELVAGLFILIGFMTRITALLLAGFCVLTALFFHNELTDPTQMAMFMKNFAIAGGFLILFAYGNMAYSFDSVRDKRRADQLRHDQEVREVKTDAHNEVVEATTETIRKPN